MTEKRFRINMEDECIDDAKNEIFIDFNDKIDFYELCELLNNLHEEKQRLKQYTKQVLQNHLNSWRGVYNPINESIIVEINVVKSIAEDLGVDYE